MEERLHQLGWHKIEVVGRRLGKIRCRSGYEGWIRAHGSPFSRSAISTEGSFCFTNKAAQRKVQRPRCRPVRHGSWRTPGFFIQLRRCLTLPTVLLPTSRNTSLGHNSGVQFLQLIRSGSPEVTLYGTVFLKAPQVTNNVLVLIASEWYLPCSARLQVIHSGSTRSIHHREV